MSTSLTGLHMSHETRLLTAHPQQKPDDVGPSSIGLRSRTSMKQDCQRRWSALSCAVCVPNQVHDIMPCWGIAPSLMTMFGMFSKLYKSTLRNLISRTRNKIQPLTFATLLPNFRKLSRTFGILSYIRNMRYAWIFCVFSYLTDLPLERI